MNLIQVKPSIVALIEHLVGMVLQHLLYILINYLGYTHTFLYLLPVFRNSRLRGCPCNVLILEWLCTCVIVAGIATNSTDQINHIYE